MCQMTLTCVGQRLCRATLQHVVAHIRSFLRFLALSGAIPSALAHHIDTPRVYRLEQLPRVLAWETVGQLLLSIDRTTAPGRRDYAMLLLIATYGLRNSDIVALTLEDMQWRRETLQLTQHKTGQPLVLPLTDAVGTALLEYLRHARPPSACRQLFLRARAPIGPLARTAVTDVFQAWARRSGLAIPFQGAHCLRHSYALHLLRQGVSLKAIGDVLGHRTVESTGGYLRLSFQDLRDVALPVPREERPGMNTAHAGSLLHPLIQQYMTLQQALGRRYHTEHYVLAGLDRFLAHHTTPDLTAETFAAWCRTQSHLKPGVRRARLRIVRTFCLYRQRTDPQCFLPDPQIFPAPHQPISPHLFTETEIVRLLRAAACLKPVPRARLRAEVFRLAIILLYTTGLRRGELLRLVIGDYDPRAQTLLIRASKFHKSRYLVLAPDGAREVEQYLQARRRHRLPVDAHIPLIGHGYAQGHAYTGGGLGTLLRQLCHSAAIRTVDGRCPRVHDFRHSFAVQALLRWYRNGDDVQAKLPFLATYMGHVSIASTAYYLPLIEALAGVASARFAAQYAALVVPLSQPLEVNS